MRRGLRIFFVCAVFPPEPEPAAVMAAELADAWRARGHLVTVVAPFPNRPGGVVYAGLRRRLRAWTTLQNGATVLRVWTWLVGPGRRSRDRVLEALSLGLAASWALLVARRPDIVVAEGWPILCQLPVVLCARLRRIPVINYCQDLHPEAVVATNLLRDGGVAARTLLALDRLVWRLASRNVVVSEGMRQQAQATRVAPERVPAVVPNWIDTETVRPVSGTGGWRAEHGIDSEAFVCMFSGSLSLASGADTLATAASLLCEDRGIVVVCIGEGPVKARLAAAIEKSGLPNLVLLPLQPRERLCEVQSSADVMLLTSAPGIGAACVPSKLITYLAVGRPVIAAVHPGSDIARVVDEAQVGLVVPPGDGAALADAVRRMKRAGPTTLARMSRQARDTAVTYYSRDAALRRFDAVLAAACGVADEQPAEFECRHV